MTVMSTPRAQPPLNRTNNPGQARWCETHLRLECTRHKIKTGEQCHAQAIRGIDKCRNHCGQAFAVAAAKGEARITAWTAIGQGLHVDAGMAVLGMLHMSWLRAAAYGELLRQQVMKDKPADPDRDGPDPGDGLDVSGLIGHRYGAAGAEGTVFAVSEEVRALVDLEAKERDRVVKFAKTAHDMGISERLTGMAERWGDVVVTRLMLVLDALQLTPAQEAQVPELIQAHLGQIDVGSLGAKGD